MDIKAIMDLPMTNPGSGDPDTLGECLRDLLRCLWEEEEGFSGKRPWGNSGWQLKFYEVLVKFDVIEGSFDEDGYLEDVDEEDGYEIICECIEEFTY
jgi:hypothetical protein